VGAFGRRRARPVPPGKPDDLPRTARCSRQSDRFVRRIAGPKLAFDGISIPYAVPNIRIECVEEDPGVPTGYWRSVGASQNAFAIEGFIDELAHAANADPVAFRLGLLQASPRHSAVLELAAHKADWGTPIAGRSRGVAVYDAHGGWVAEIAEVSVLADDVVKVHRVVCAVDCGFAVNPDTVAAQIEVPSFSVSPPRSNPRSHWSTATSCKPASRFPVADDRRHARCRGSHRTEPGSSERSRRMRRPPIAPAVANAIFAATGRRFAQPPVATSASNLRRTVRVVMDDPTTPGTDRCAYVASSRSLQTGRCPSASRYRR